MNYDVVVVGAGPAGATAAKFLAEQNINVLLLDKSRFPREKPCGGMISIRTLKRFPYIPKNLIASYSFGGGIHSSSLGSQVLVRHDEPVAAFVVRKDFDHGLVSCAKESGSAFLDGVAVTDIHRQKENISVILSDGTTVTSKLVIGADGVWSVVARKVGLGHHYPRIGRCLFQELPVDSDKLNEYFSEKKQFQLYVKFLGVDGFGWVIPKKDCVNIGIGEIQPTSSQQRSKPPLHEVYRRYLRFLIEEKRVPPVGTDGKLQGGSLPLTPLEITYGDRVLLCGDAAGQMNPLTGDGIHYAMSSGKYAAEVCALALHAGTTDASFLSQYQTMWKHDFGKEIRLFGRVLKLVLKKDHDEKYIRLLAKDPQIIKMMLTMANTQGRIEEYQWRILRRFIPLYMKDLVGQLIS